MILLQLPLPDMLLAQRVNRAWKTIVTDSPKLQRALFFKPVTDKGMVFLKPPYCLLLCTGSADCDRMAEYLNVDDESLLKTNIDRWAFEKDDGKTVLQPILNPFVQQACPDLCDNNEYVYCGRDPRVDIQRELLNEAMSRPEGSWRRMLYTQPPLRAAAVDQSRASHSHRLVLRDAGLGVTLGDVDSSQTNFDAGASEVCGIGRIRQLSRRRFERAEVTGEAMLHLMQGTGV